MSSGFFRVILAGSVALIAGSAYHAEKIGKIVQILQNETFDLPPSPSLIDSSLPAFVAALCWLVLTLCINRYVNYRQISVIRMLTMSVELCLMCVCIGLPHIEKFDHAHLTKFAWDQLFNLCLVTLTTFLLGFKRCPSEVQVHGTDSTVPNLAGLFTSNGVQKNGISFH